MYILYMYMYILYMYIVYTIISNIIVATVIQFLLLTSTKTVFPHSLFFMVKFLPSNFCLSGSTPERQNSWAFSNSGGSSLLQSTWNFFCPHFTLTK